MFCLFMREKLFLREAQAASLSVFRLLAETHFLLGTRHPQIFDFYERNHNHRPSGIGA
jgi:hypothetical protein